MIDSMRQSRYRRGFTIVELLIVIVVIGLLAAIAIVAYSGIRDRAQRAALQSDLASAAKKMQLARAEDGSYPSSFPSDIKTSPGVVLSLTVSSDPANQFCINGYGSANMTASVSSSGSVKDSLCPAPTTGTPIGGSIPPIPAGTNLVAGFASWTLSGGITYNSSSGQLCASSTAGNAISPLVRVEGSLTSRLIVDVYATQPSPSFTPQSGALYHSDYYGFDGTSYAYNTSNYIGNGNAQAVNLSTWTTHQWGPQTGPNVAYIRFTISSSPSNYTSDTCYRNPQITITR